MTINELLEYGKTKLTEAGIENGRNEAGYLLEALLHAERTYLFLHGAEVVKPEVAERYQAWIVRRCTHYPMQYILGEQPFMGFTFYVNEHVLIPRQDTEVLVEEAEKRLISGMQVLDLCCGSGCIGLSLARRKGVNVTLTDISEGALTVTAENARRLGFTPAGTVMADDEGSAVSPDSGTQQVGILQSDLFDKVTGCYDMIVSNPPYIRTDVIPTLMEEVREYEPVLALDGREDGLFFYRRIVKEAGSYLNENGYICFEIGYDQGEDLRQILVDARYRDIQIVKDLAGLDRVVLARKG